MNSFAAMQIWYIYSYFVLNKRTLTSFLSLDKNGNVQRVHYNNPVRDQFPVIPSKDTLRLYKALKRFNDIAYDDTILIKHKLKPGKKE